jgi:ABC-type sugar transport system permease subunit
MVLLHAAIITIPKDLYEAAYLDGATRWGCFLNVTLPLIMNTLMVVMIVLTVQTFNMVTLIYGLTAGGPVDVTTTMSFKIFYEAFFNFRLAMACVMGIVMFVANILFAIAYVATLRREALY